MSKHGAKIIILSLAFCSFASAVFSTNISNYQRASISQNCATIKQSLKSLQYADSKTRSVLGSTYQSILTDFITPLNLRLVKENRSDPKLSQFQADFATAKDSFSTSFIKYSQSLEELLNTNCQSDPDLFYSRLESTRSLRKSLQDTSSYLNKLYQDHLTVVSNLKLKAPSHE